MAVDVNDLQDAVEALEAKVGITSSGVSTSLDYKVNNFFAAGRKVYLYENTAPTGWSITAVTDSVLAVKGGAGLYNDTGGTNVGTSWANLKAHTHTGPSHTHTGPSHTHTGPSHTHALGQSGSTANISTTKPIVTNGANIITVTETGGGNTYNNISDITAAGGTAATGADGTGATGAGGTAASGAQSTADVRPIAALGIIITKA